MKQLLPLLLLIFTYPATAQFCYEPQQPQAGQTVSFTYTPQQTTLTTDSTLEGRYVRYGAPDRMQISQPTTVTLVRQGSNFVGQVFMPKKDVAGVMLYFRNSRQPQCVDINGGRMYVVPVWDGSNHLLPHATGGQASVFTRTHFPYEMNYRPDPSWVVTLYQSELAQNPQLRPSYWSDLIAAQIKQKKVGYGPQAKADIDSYLASRTPSPAELATAAGLYESIGDMAKAKTLRERQKTADPSGSLMQRDRAVAIRAEPDWTKKKAGYQAFVHDYPTSPQIPGLAVVMTDGYYRTNDIRGLMAFVEQLPPAQTDELVLGMIANLLAEDKRSLPEAEQLAKRALSVLQTKGKSVSDVAARHRQLMNTYARTLEQQGNYADAFTAYKDVIDPDDVDNIDPQTTERYFTAALRTNHAADALPMVEAAIGEGRATTGTKNALLSWYAKQPGNTPAKANAYLADLEADLKSGQRDDLTKQLINEPAPAFSLFDLQGRTISSSALRGKVVVVDFWATWCGPCIASFPAMQQAQRRFESDPNVRFLFVNTREGGPVQRVYDFMRKHPYNFVVPLDVQQTMSKAYNVQGIPTKVVIGPNGRVRYRQIGYSGDSETMVNELAMIVDMLKDGK